MQLNDNNYDIMNTLVPWLFQFVKNQNTNSGNKHVMFVAAVCFLLLVLIFSVMIFLFCHDFSVQKS